MNRGFVVELTPKLQIGEDEHNRGKLDPFTRDKVSYFRAFSVLHFVASIT